MAIRCWPVLCFTLFFSNIQSDQTSYGDVEPVIGIEKKNAESFSETRKRTSNSDNKDQFSNELKYRDLKEEHEDFVLKRNVRNENKSINVKIVKSYLELIIKDLRRHINHLKSLTNLKDVEVKMRNIQEGNNIQEDNIQESNKGMNCNELNMEDDHVNKIKNKNTGCKLCKIIPASKYTSSNGSTNYKNVTTNENSTIHVVTNNNIQNKIITVNKQTTENTSNSIKNDRTSFVKNLTLVEIKTQLIYFNKSKESNVRVEKMANNQTKSFSIDSAEVDNLIQLLTESMILDITDSVNKRAWDAVDDEEDEENDGSKTVQESLNKLTEKYLMKKRSDWIALLKKKWLKKPKVKSRIKNKKNTKERTQDK
ncbi:ABC transporter G family member 7 isoform X1 [Hydra vulgaris]|uniref:ABC transporter G family member 7 isoform X1 n=1 Tax=Hydra vulgaris TaxID=6087 RepID=UPI001F5F5FB4|nr:ABC transporter G family member 7 isoform X1 [Hydra vulgaris]XP_047123861.1 ABC transporter G family member 7 isoform X1 [Hydra vulgaris]